jgi:hypothetical protein
MIVFDSRFVKSVKWRTSCYTVRVVRIKQIHIGDSLDYGNETQFRASLGLEPKKPVSYQIKVKNRFLILYPTKREQPASDPSPQRPKPEGAASGARQVLF